MLWQDRNGTWYSTTSPFDPIVSKKERELRSKVNHSKSGDELFKELFEEFYS